MKPGCVCWGRGCRAEWTVRQDKAKDDIEIYPQKLWYILYIHLLEPKSNEKSIKLLSREMYLVKFDFSNEFSLTMRKMRTIRKLLLIGLVL